MTTPDSPKPASPDRTAVTGLLACGWVGFFVFAFFYFGPSYDLPDGSISRTEVALSAPELASELAARLAASGESESWRSLPYGLILRAALLVAACVCVGRLALRLIRVRELPRLELLVFGYALGISTISLLVLGCGLLGMLSRGLIVSLLCLAVAAEGILSLTRKQQLAPSESRAGRDPRGTVLLSLAIMLPMLVLIVLGATSPPTDFDVREYHLQGPKEFFQNGHISLLTHNAYTSFPFLTEMLSLCGMVVEDDWYSGALLGKLLLASFAPMTALALIAAGRRSFSGAAGWLAAAIFLTTPWVYRVSIIAYAEGGLMFYLFAAVLAVQRAASRQASDILLVGLVSGSAMACKYPALLLVVFPCGLAILARSWKPGAGSPRAAVRSAIVFGSGVIIAVGPWLVKNTFETGNPVYPLAYSVFGGTDWTPEIDARWRAAHSPPNHDPADLFSRVVEVSIGSRWMSGILFACAPLALMAENRKSTVGLWLFLLWLFGSWWVFTHRIDRFWVPMIPVVSLLAAAGVSSLPVLARRACLAVVIVLTMLNVLFSSSGWSGYNAWLTEPAVARKSIESRFARLLLTAESLNAASPSPGRVLSVGEAAVFEARTDVIYNTVFDLSIFQRLCGESVTGGPDPNVVLRPAADVRSRLADEGIRMIAVDWREVLRYRAPGSYGFTDFVRPETFARLVSDGVIRRVESFPGRWDALSADAQAFVASLREDGLFRAQEIYEVLPDEP